jgi:hypothetical protein
MTLLISALILFILGVGATYIYDHSVNIKAKFSEMKAKRQMEEKLKDETATAARLTSNKILATARTAIQKHEADSPGEAFFKELENNLNLKRRTGKPNISTGTSPKIVRSPNSDRDKTKATVNVLIKRIEDLKKNPKR